MRIILSFALVFFIIVSGFSALALEGCGERGGDCSRCHNLTIDEANSLLKNAGLKVKNVKQADVRGFWELAAEQNGRVGSLYMSYSKKYVLPGPLFKVSELKPVQPPQEKKTTTDVSKIPLDNSIIMGNPKGKKRLFVFTDPDCPYCRKLHGELQKLVNDDPEVAIYVKMYPLSFHPKAHDKARVILGSKSVEMLDKAMRGETLPEPGSSDPAGPVDDSMRFAESIGVKATPTMVFPSGEIVVGGRDAQTLRTMLEGK